MKKRIVLLVMLAAFTSANGQTISVDSCQFYRSEYQRLRVKVQLAQQNLYWMDRFVNIVAKNPSQAKFVKGWANRVKAAKLFPEKKP
jgi:hypothetical protein